MVKGEPSASIDTSFVAEGTTNVKQSEFIFPLPSVPTSVML